MTDVRTHLSACFCSATTCMCTFGCYVPAHPKPHHSYATPHPAESIEKRFTRLPTHTVPLCSMHCRRSQPKITCLAFLQFCTCLACQAPFPHQTNASRCRQTLTQNDRRCKIRNAHSNSRAVSLKPSEPRQCQKVRKTRFVHNSAVV